MTTKEQSIYLPELATISKVEKLTETEKFFEIKFNSGKDLGHKPGQFVEVSVFGVGEAPISISSSPTKKGSFDLAIRKVGNVTNAIHNLKAGSTVGIRGPFGTCFPYEETKGKDILFVAGGIGLVPARSFINYVLHNRKDYGRVIIFFGSRSPKERLFLNELADWEKRSDVEYYETVDKGDETWKGNVGVITTLFPKTQVDPAKTYCVVVGPPIMYRFVIKEALDRKIPKEQIIVSLERRMKCGVGKCGHCQINGVYVCQDGPVFKYSDITNLEEAL
jgi:sulfite reductase subunit B